jgi:lipoprotein-anchoring transpeptidase ErfK/SrfK
VSQPRIRIDLGRQRLELRDGDEVRVAYPVSTASRGAGERFGSERTPRGAHQIRAVIGVGAPERAVFVGRRATGEICTPESYAAEPERDWILTRILWLAGLEPGRNRSGDVDTFRRTIYIHGTPDEASLGTPGSHGCIRMGNAEVIDLCARVHVGTRVDIVE